MGRLAIVFFLIFLLFFCSGFLWAEQPLAADKISHFWFSFLITQYFKNQNFSDQRTFCYTLGLGTIKEIYDYICKPKIDGPDLLFDLLGILAALAVTLK